MAEATVPDRPNIHSNLHFLHHHVAMGFDCTLGAA